MSTPAITLLLNFQKDLSYFGHFVLLAKVRITAEVFLLLINQADYSKFKTRYYENRKSLFNQKIPLVNSKRAFCVVSNRAVVSTKGGIKPKTRVLCAV